MSEVQATKFCPKCQTPKPVEEFYRHKIHKDGLDNKCKKCSKEYQKTRSATVNGSLYVRWNAMKARCERPLCQQYRNYGGRGISVCPEWHNFNVFQSWALANGYQRNLQIDRIDVNGNYEPSNCRFVTPVQNARNTRGWGSSKYSGVSKIKSNGRWRAGVKLPEKWLWIGVYSTEEEAARARDAVAVPLGYRANFPKESS